MPRPFRFRAIAAALALVAAGCQDYNFNPVGHCLIQPGTQRFTLSNLSTADVLFVVDDSGSMAGKQARLASAFDDFVNNLTSTNAGRANAGLLPIDFHIATTTTSVFYNRQTPNQVCSNTYAPPVDGPACAIGTAPVYGPKACTGPSDSSTCTVAGTACRNTCNKLKDEYYCCAADGTFPPNSINSVGGAKVRCNLVGQPCGALQTHYDFAGMCPVATQGVALDQMPFPDGDFVSIVNTGAVTANPRVLHFDKRLYLSDDGSGVVGKNAQGFTMAQLKTFFRQNIAVGTCGSAQEQGLVAAQDALAKAFGGKQKDTWAYVYADGQSASGTITSNQTFTVTNGIPSATSQAAWPSPTSKMVVVYVGDEDDCSSQKDPAAGVILLDTDQSGADACVRDSTTSPPIGGKETQVASFVSSLTGFGRQMGAAFIESFRSNSDPSSCSNATCVAGYCCDLSCTATCPPPTGSVCGGQAPGTRFLDAASQLQGKADLVVGSVCSDFGPILESVAEIVKPPQTLSLPTLPAEERIAILRIGTPSSTRKICGRPLPPNPNPGGGYTRATAEATGADWWFTPTSDPAPPYDPTGTSTVAVPTRFVYINPQGACKANPGETYSADYLGVVPSGGCVQQAGDIQGGTVAGSVDCQAKLGGQFSDWECFVPPGLTTGTCTCRSSGG